jgi:uncharacterized membrane protein YtjA (UPF0391 family)
VGDLVRETGEPIGVVAARSLALGSVALVGLSGSGLARVGVAGTVVSLWGHGRLLTLICAAANAITIAPVPPSARAVGTISSRHDYPHRSGACLAATYEELIMFGWAIAFLLVALVAAVLGFGGIASFAVDIARIIFFVAIVLFAISAVVTLIRGRSLTMP